MCIKSLLMAKMTACPELASLTSRTSPCGLENLPFWSLVAPMESLPSRKFCWSEPCVLVWCVKTRKPGTFPFHQLNPSCGTGNWPSAASVELP